MPQFKMGRKRPVARCPMLTLGNYLKKSLPAPPLSMDYATRALPSLNKIYLNDQLGDCVIACMAHVVGVLTGNVGVPTLYSDAQITTLYSAIGGYVPGNPLTDQGCNEQDALNYWKNEGAPLGSHKIAGWISVNPQDPNEYRTALWLFENLVYGIEIPNAWTQVTASGFTWGPGIPNPANGHCVAGVGYDSAGVQIATWGMVGTITDTAMSQTMTQQYGGELYTVVSVDALDAITQKAPTGFDWSQLVADFDALGGSIPQPTPVPPNPNPTPTPVNLQQQVDALFAATMARWPHNPRFLRDLNALQGKVDTIVAGH